MTDAKVENRLQNFLHLAGVAGANHKPWQRYRTTITNDSQ
jgi:hypothetical protein